MLELPQTEESFWRESYKTSLYPALSEDLELDAVIVGGGITGLTSAYLLKKSGLKVAVVEKDTIGGGTTGRTTGKVTSQHDLFYNNFRDKMGQKITKIYGDANQSAVEKVASIISKEKIDCDWSREDNYVFTTDTSKVQQMQQEAQAAASAGLPASFVTSTPLPFGIEGAVKFTGQGKMNAQKYLLGLAAAVNGKGSFVFENSRVIGIRDGSPAKIRTSEAAITAKNIIVATNVPTMPLAARGGYCVLEYPTESYLVAGKLDKKIDGMYISPDNQHYSILPIVSDKQNLLLIGGEGGNVAGFRLNKTKRYQRLARYANELFGVESITHRWSDRDYSAYDNMPLIGKLYPWSKHLYVGTAYKKWGLSGGTLAGMVLHDLICNIDNQWSDVFKSNRIRPILSIPKTATQFIKG